MPVYEYECGACGGRFEMMQKFSDPAPSVCAVCKSEKVRKVLSPTSFVLKGSGWYATDYPTTDRKQAGAEHKEESKPKDDPKPAPPCGAAACPSGGCPASKG